MVSGTVGRVSVLRRGQGLRARPRVEGLGL
jgi:hypothetical protein